jgi:hypothetical protein
MPPIFNTKNNRSTKKKVYHARIAGFILGVLRTLDALGGPNHSLFSTPGKEGTKKAWIPAFAGKSGGCGI